MHIKKMGNEAWCKAHLKGLFANILAATLIFSCSPVWAEENNTDEATNRLGEIVVTATKMSTEVDKIPTNISVITHEELKQYPGYYNALNVLQDLNIPGMFFSTNSSGSGNGDISISTRGSENSYWAMKVMVNGVEFNRGKGYIRPGRLAIHDIERIEITKTPSAEYGDQAIGGVINIITRKADSSLEGKAGLAFSSLGGGNAYSVFNGTKGKWDYYIDASAVREDTYQDGGYLDGNNLYSKVGYTLNDDASLEFHGSHKDSQGIYSLGLTREQFEEDPTQNINTGADQYNESEEDLGALVYQQQLGHNELMAKVEMQKSSYKYYYSGYYGEEKSWAAHSEINMTLNNSINGMANKIVIGGEYRFHKLDPQMYSGSSSFYNRGTIYGDYSREDISYAGYLQDELRATDALTISAGIRYDYFDLEQTANNANSSSWTQETGDFSPKIGFTYQFCDKVNVFAGFNSGIKSPVRLPQSRTNGKLEPEKLRVYEIGIRGYVSNWLNYNTAFFLQKVTDKFVRPGVKWTSQYENAGETTAKGVELGAKVQLPSNFYAATSFTYQQSEFEEFVSQGVDYSGNKLTGVPDIIFSFKLGYMDDLLGDISLNPVYTGKRYFNYANTNEDDGFWVLNARYAKTFGKVELYVAANNLFDEMAVGSGSGSPGNETLYPINGLNAVVGMNVRF